MNLSSLILTAFFLLSGCTGAIAPTNEGENPGGSAFKNAKKGGEGEAEAATTGGETTAGAETGAGTTEGGEAGETEVPAVGEAIGVSGDFTGLALKYISAVHRPTYQMSGVAMPASITFTMSEYSSGTKKIKEYQCLDCDDEVITCFCAKDENKDDDKCTGGSGSLEYDMFSFTFSAKNALIPLQSGQVHQVDDSGYPKKKDYELKLVPTDFQDPNYAAFTSSNSLEGLSGYYTFMSSDTTKMKSRGSFVGTLKFASNITSSSKDFEFDLDVTFKKTTVDTAADQKFKGKFKGPIAAYVEPPTYPTSCALPDKYVKIVYE
jgi:hypothetical protein